MPSAHEARKAARDEAVRAWLEAAWHERRAAIRAWLPLANAALAVIDELARGKAALTAAETAEDLDAAIAGCERVRDTSRVLGASFGSAKSWKYSDRTTIGSRGSRSER